jgi:hypothetical protein
MTDQTQEFYFTVKVNSVEKLDEVYGALEAIDGIEIYHLVKVATRESYEASKDTGKHYEKNA